jgi:hypothetical protein
VVAAGLPGAQRAQLAPGDSVAAAEGPRRVSMPLLRAAVATELRIAS